MEMIYTKFVSLISSDPIVQTLLPLTPQVRQQDLRMPNTLIIATCASLLRSALGALLMAPFMPHNKPAHFGPGEPHRLALTAMLCCS